MVQVSAVLLVTGAVVIDQAGGKGKEVRHGPIERFMLWLGSISYSLYLCHVPVQTLVYAGLGSPYRSPFSLAAMIIAPIFVASASYMAIERPVQRIARRFAKGGLRKTGPEIALSGTIAGGSG
jgi:peptidoglycan/LPS O-acetylase OafA/YrhL